MYRYALHFIANEFSDVTSAFIGQSQDATLLIHCRGVNII